MSFGVSSRVVVLRFAFRVVSPLPSAVGPARGWQWGTAGMGKSPFPFQHVPHRAQSPSLSPRGRPRQLEQATWCCCVWGLLIAEAHPGTAARRPRCAGRSVHQRACHGHQSQAVPLATAQERKGGSPALLGVGEKPSEHRRVRGGKAATLRGTSRGVGEAVEGCWALPAARWGEDAALCSALGCYDETSHQSIINIHAMKCPWDGSFCGAGFCGTNDTKGERTVRVGLFQLLNFTNAGALL